MPVPPLNENGLPPPGIHDCTAEELEAQFGGFTGNEARPRLMAKLTEFLAEARASGIVQAVLVDGSFVTAKPATNDVDLIVVLAAEHDFSSEMIPLEYNVISKRRVQRRYGFDILVAREGAVEYDRWVSFFQQVRLEPGAGKGILRVKL